MHQPYLHTNSTTKLITYSTALSALHSLHLEGLHGDAHEEAGVLEVLVALAHHVAQMQRAQPGLDAGHRHGRKGDELVTQHVLVIHVEGQVRQVRAPHVEDEGLKQT